MLKDILDYEKKLLTDRNELLKLLEAHEVENDEIINTKLKFFQQELEHMNHQYEILFTRVNLKEAQTNVSDTDVLNEYMTAENINATQINTSDEHAINDRIADKDEIANGRESEFTQTKQKKNLEKAIGSSLMGILASGLIFISLILFATLILPYLGEAVKLLSCYLFSFSLIGVSLFKLHKEKENKFYLSLAGCGVGALYITLLLTNIYFKYITDIPLFILITIWVAFVCYLSKERNKIFHIIGQLGVTISIIFGSTACTESYDFAKFVSLTIFYIVAFGALYSIHFEKEAAFNKIGNIFGCINLSVMFFAGITFIDDTHSFYFFFMTMLALLHVVALFLTKWEKAKTSYGVFTSINSILIALFASGFIKDDLLFGLFVYAVAIALLFAAEFKPKTFQGGNTWIQISMTILAFIGLASNKALYYHGFVWLLILPIVYLGFFRERKVCRFIGLFLTFIYFCIEPPIAESFTLSLLVIIGLYALMYMKKEVYSLSFKICLHLLGVLFFLIVGAELLEEFISDYDIRNALTYILIATYNFGLAMSPFSKNLKTGTFENKACYNILNILLMAVGLSQISEPTALHIPVILVTLVIYFMNSKNLLEKHQHFFAGAYVGLKFTILLVVILDSFDAANYVTSSLCIIFAIACIVLGFVKDYKYLRIYGLLLSMISVFKLVVVDIRYENTLGNAVSFFVSGILCFAISMIYNYIDKKMTGIEKDV